MDFELASVSRWRAEEVKRGVVTILGTKPSATPPPTADGSRARLALSEINPNEQAGNDADGADLAKADHGISGLLVRALNADR